MTVVPRSRTVETILSRVIGKRDERELRSLFSSLMVGNAAHFALVAYIGIWGLRHLGLSAGEVGAAYLLGAGGAALGGPLAGRLSDAVGRVRVTVWALLAHLLVTAPLVVLNKPPATLVVLGVAGSMTATASRGAAVTAAVADLLATREPHDRGERFAQMRVAANVGAIIGPVIGGLIIVVGWPLFFGFVVALDAVALLQIRRVILARSEPGCESVGSARTPVFGALVACAVALTASWSLYYLFEVVLPVAATGHYHVPAPLWGTMFALNAVSIIVLQVRVTRYATRWPLSRRLSVCSMLLGGAFFALPAMPTVVGVAVTVLIFSVGEMIWLPSAQELMLELAPAGHRGFVMGVLNATTWLGLGIASNAALPFVTGELVSVVWLSASVPAVVGVFGYHVACRLGRNATGNPSEPARDLRRVG